MLPESKVVVPVFYSPQYVGAAHAFDTTRKSKWIADSLAVTPIPGVLLAEPVLLTRGQLATVHDPDYVNAVETGKPRHKAESQGFTWDPGLWPMVQTSNGGVVAAALAAMKDGVAGSLSSGLHHARFDRGSGFCTFNGLVLAARAALDAGAKSVLILDLDAHCGGGTASMIAGEPRIQQRDVSVSAFDFFEPDDQCTLALPVHANDYLPAIRAQLDLPGEFDLCLYNAGMDPCETCGVGGLKGITPAMLAERERMVFDWCRRRSLPVAFVLAGGYVGSRLDQAGLVNLHRLTLEAAVG
jgi:acetoin utilization deacetylase AcuC-like enzyme